MDANTPPQRGAPQSAHHIAGMNRCGARVERALKMARRAGHRGDLIAGNQPGWMDAMPVQLGERLVPGADLCPASRAPNPSDPVEPGVEALSGAEALDPVDRVHR